MASPSPLLMILSQDSTKVQAGSNNEASKSEPPKLPRGRKPSKSSKSPLKKKPSQRGMGVERLERLRLQEKWGGSIPEVTGFPPHHHHQFHQAPPLIPVAASPSAFVGSELNRPSFMASKVSLGGGAYGNVTRDWVGGILETSSNELSSMPKVQCHRYEACCSSKVKKCMNMEEMGLILGGKDKLVPSMINCHVLTGLNHGHTVGLELKDFNPSRAMSRQIYHQVSKESELMDHITRSSSALKEYEFFPPEKSLKEYEFFPGSSSDRRSFEQPHHTTEATASSYLIIPSDQYNAAAAATSNPLDLSLKLSL
ncbi:hypothetical protein QQ045_007415 [Rhodiola kirilowii]